MVGEVLLLRLITAFVRQIKSRPARRRASFAFDPAPVRPIIVRVRACFDLFAGPKCGPVRHQEDTLERRTVRITGYVESRLGFCSHRAVPLRHFVRNLGRSQPSASVKWDLYCRRKRNRRWAAAELGNCDYSDARGLSLVGDAEWSGSVRWPAIYCVRRARDSGVE